MTTHTPSVSCSFNPSTQRVMENALHPSSQSVGEKVRHAVDSPDRRGFLKTVGLAAAAAAVGAKGLRAAPEAMTGSSTGPYQIGILEKWFFDGGESGQFKYTPEETAQTLDEIGLDLELTLRKKGGHITPEAAPDELPIMAAALAKKNRRILWVAMDTVRPDEPHWEKALRTSRALGITQYRHRGFQYVSGKPLKAQIASFHSMAKEFAAANREIGIQALYQTHAGAHMAGSGGWDLDLILGDIDPKDFGVAYDTQHMTVEGGLAWPNTVEILAPRTATLCVKSFQWVDGVPAPVGVPLGQGRVHKDIVDKVIAAHGGPLPICIHIEYFKPSGKLAAVPFAQRAEIVAAFRHDAGVLKNWLGLPA